MLIPGRELFVLALVLVLGCSGGGGGSSGSTAPKALGVPPAQMAPAKTKSALVVKRAGSGWLETEQGRLFAHVKGTPTEMGEQYGELMGDRIEAILTRLPAFAQQNQLPAYLLPSVAIAAAGLFEQYYPRDVKDYLDGIMTGARRQNPNITFTLNDLIFMNALVDLGGITNSIFCSSIAVWGDHTVGGKMFQTRCVDLFTGSGLEDHTLVCVEKRDGHVPWANAGWCGLIGGASGLSANGVGIGQVWAFSQDKAFGTPWPLTTRRIMEQAQNSEDAVAIFRAERYRTYGANFVFGDIGIGRGGAPKAMAIESSCANFSTFVDDDPKEDLALWQGQPYGIRIKEAVFRGDCCLDPTLRARQTASSGPTGDPRGAGAYKARYKGQADALLAIEALGPKIGAAEMIELTKRVAMPGGSLQCCVYANSDRQLYVANARIAAPNVDAFNEPYVRYDFEYYLPTIKATLGRATPFARGEAMGVTVEWSTTGTDRDLELSLRIEDASGTRFAPANFVAPTSISYRAANGGKSEGVSLALPQSLGAGSYKLVAEVFERGTSDLVDLSVAPFTIQ